MQAEWLETFHGFLLVDKPAGMTSQDVITRLQHALIAKYGGKKKTLPKMGHGGTLDPFATGLLVVAVGDGVKLTRYLLGSEKTYEGEIRFGEQTASGDLTNEVTARTDTLPKSREVLEKIATDFTLGAYEQLPPMYSAKKIEGIPLYEHARKGINVERAVVTCFIRECSIEETVDAPAGVRTARIRTRVTAGTFIRTFAEDLAIRAGSLGHLTALRRSASGPLMLNRAKTLDELVSVSSAGGIWSNLDSFIPFHRALDGILPRFEITEGTARKIFSGEVRTLADLTLPESLREESIALYNHGRMVAIVRDGNPQDGTVRRIERGFPLRSTDLL